MIAFLKGTIVARDFDKIILEVNNVGYEIYMSTSSLQSLMQSQSDELVHIHMNVKEDEISLYGFCTQEEKSVFEQLISVSGVGPKLALAALSTYSAQDIASLISTQDIAGIQKISGVGKKMASRIVLELKGSLDEAFNADKSFSSPAVASAREALESMGFNDIEIREALDSAPAEANENELIQLALRNIGAR